jgi:Lrp/AsnC family transcriptional regulator of ectoine degradation
MKRSALDATDIRILSAVQDHGQLSKMRLAEIVNLSPTPCWARLDRLKAAGFIQGYHAEVALDRIADFTQLAVTVSLTHHRRTDFERFEAYIRNIDEITHCIATGGGIDYIMTVFVPRMAAFQTLMDDLLSADISIDRYVIYIATRQVKNARPNLAKLTSTAPR